MTKNQREFQKEINRLLRSIKSLESKGFKQATQLPTQPKRVSKKYITELKQLKGRQFVEPIELPKHSQRKAKPEVSIRKGRKLGISDTVSIPSGLPRLTRKDKGVKRGALDPEERARRNAKRLETLKNKPKSTKPRKVRKDKGTHLSDEERLKRKAKRDETLAKKNAQYALTHETPAETEYDMIADIIERLDKAWNTVEEEHDYLYNVRDGYLQELLQLMHDNIDQDDYYLTLKGREEEIQNEIDGVVWGSTQPIVDGSYQNLMSLLTPKDVLLPDLKAIAEEGESIKALNHTVEDGYYG